MLRKEAFGSDFYWGVSTAAYQIEGAHRSHGKGPSIWDDFVTRRGKILGGHHANEACDFHRLYAHDLDLMQMMQIRNFRFSLSWSRILPEGIGHVNQSGLDFYERLVDACLERDIEPWVTLYHWDLPLALERKGGWINRDIEHWFTEFIECCANRLGDRIQYWMILNEPMVFTGAGYFLGVHAPGKLGIRNFMKAAHHATICQAQGARVLRSVCSSAQIGTTFSCSYLQPASDSEKDKNACIRMDALLNRMFIEPALGLGYPVNDLPLLSRIYQEFRADDENLLVYDFDFIGVQNYTREIVSHSYIIPYMQAKIIKASKRNVDATLMDWEVYPESIYHMLHQFARYPNVPRLIVTENGAAFPDVIIDGEIDDAKRTSFLQQYINQIHRAKSEGVKVEGYFIWTFMDNFEWAEGYFPRFGLVYIDFKTQQRILKNSGKWYASFLGGDGILSDKIDLSKY